MQALPQPFKDSQDKRPLMRFFKEEPEALKKKKKKKKNNNNTTKKTWAKRKTSVKRRSFDEIHLIEHDSQSLDYVRHFCCCYRMKQNMQTNTESWGTYRLF